MEQRHSTELEDGSSFSKRRNIPRSFSYGASYVDTSKDSISRGRRRRRGSEDDLYKKTLYITHKGESSVEKDYSKLLPFVDSSVQIILDNDFSVKPVSVGVGHGGWNETGGMLSQRFRVPTIRMLFLSNLDGSFFDGTHLTRWILRNNLQHEIDLIGILGYCSFSRGDANGNLSEQQQRAIQGDLATHISLLEGICVRVVFVPGPYDPDIFRLTRSSKPTEDSRLHLTNNSYHLYRHGLKLADDLLLVDPSSFRMDTRSNRSPFLLCKDWNIWNFHAMHRLSPSIVWLKERKEKIGENDSKQRVGVITMMSYCKNSENENPPYDSLWTDLLRHHCLFKVEYGKSELNSDFVCTSAERKEVTIYPGNFSTRGEFVLAEITRHKESPHQWIVKAIQRKNLDS
eukprot:jgi/Galph1/5459/GphlegSOOS_G4096.1